MNRGNIKYLSAGDTAIIVYGNNMYYSSLVHNITEDNGIIIYTPQENINNYLLECETFEVYFNREDAQYKFTAIIKSQFQEGHLALTEIMPVSEVTRNQRREYCRLRITLPVKIRKCDGDDNEENPLKPAYLVDISATGIKISTKDKYEIASAVEVKMRLDNEAYSLKCKILGIHMPENIDDIYYIRMCFIDIPKQQKDSIVSFIFKEQLKLRAKGIL